MWKQYLILAVSLPLCGFNCARPIPRWDGEIYAARSDQRALVRKQANEVIPADSAEFDEFMAMRWKGDKGFEGFYTTYILGCEKWKKGVEKIDAAEALRELSVIRDSK